MVTQPHLQPTVASAAGGAAGEGASSLPPSQQSSSQLSQSEPTTGGAGRSGSGRRRAWGHGHGKGGGGGGGGGASKKKEPMLTLWRCRLMKDYSSGYLYRACEQGDGRAVQRLLREAKAEEEARSGSDSEGEHRGSKLSRMLRVRDDTYGYTALHAAVRAGHPAVVQVVLRYCSSEHIEAEDLWGQTPLWIGCCYGRPEEVRMLLEAGAEDRGNICRKSALEVARHKAHPRCQALLERHHGQRTPLLLLKARVASQDRLRLLLPHALTQATAAMAAVAVASSSQPPSPSPQQPQQQQQSPPRVNNDSQIPTYLRARFGLPTQAPGGEEEKQRNRGGKGNSNSNGGGGGSGFSTMTMEDRRLAMLADNARMLAAAAAAAAATDGGHTAKLPPVCSSTLPAEVLDTRLPALVLRPPAYLFEPMPMWDGGKGTAAASGGNKRLKVSSEDEKGGAGENGGEGEEVEEEWRDEGFISLVKGSEEERAAKREQLLLARAVLGRLVGEEGIGGEGGAPVCTDVFTELLSFCDMPTKHVR